MKPCTARAWMQYNKLPLLLNEWFTNIPDDEKVLIGRVVGKLVYLSEKRRDKVTFTGVGNYLQELINQGGIA